MRLSLGFQAIACADARVLVLGSLPGQKSLQERQYYAHPRNAFWPIMNAIFGIHGDYEVRCQGLTDNAIALWDVLESSVRPGSLDSDIRNETAKANNFGTFLAQHQSIERIVFNGKKAEELFLRMVVPRLATHISLRGAPSTSPAYAAMPYTTKLNEWQAAMRPILDTTEGPGDE